MNAEILRRSGRPDQQASEDLLRHIVDTAERLFIAQGYAATSLEQIAAAAGSGKQTLYRRFGSKEGLFTEVINRQGQRLLEVARAAETTGADPLDALRECGRLMFDFVLKADMISLHRILVAEVVRFPELGVYVLENCLGPFKALMDRLLRAAVAAGEIRIADVDLVHTLLMGLLAGWPSHEALLGRSSFVDEAARDRYFEAAWGLFLRGVS